jgi:hypothetical protein
MINHLCRFDGFESKSDICVGSNVLGQAQPPGSHAPTKPKSSESLEAAGNRKGGGCWLQGAGWAVYVSPRNLSALRLKCHAAASKPSERGVPIT